METALRSRLLTNSGISSLVGDRIYWGSRPQKSGLPAIVLRKISPGRAYHFEGAIGSQGARVQFDCLGLNVRDVKPLFAAVLAEMEQSATVDGVKFAMSFLDSERDVAPVDVEGVGAVVAVSADFIVWFSSEGN